MRTHIERFMRWRKENVPEGEVFAREFGDGGTLVAEVRRGDKRYVGTMYHMRRDGKTFKKVKGSGRLFKRPSDALVWLKEQYERF